MMWVPKIGSGSKSGEIRCGPPRRDPPSANCTRPSGEAGKKPPCTIPFKVTDVHAGDGFGIDFTVVTVGKPSAYAGGEARTPATIGTSARIATRVAHLLDFISAPRSTRHRSPGKTRKLEEPFARPRPPAKNVNHVT